VRFANSPFTDVVKLQTDDDCAREAEFAAAENGVPADVLLTIALWIALMRMHRTGLLRDETSNVRVTIIASDVQRATELIRNPADSLLPRSGIV
jgi:hypothetical protein